ncbi:unnamed protein product, partial [Polarella glacialis]
MATNETGKSDRRKYKVAALRADFCSQLCPNSVDLVFAPTLKHASQVIPIFFCAVMLSFVGHDRVTDEIDAAFKESLGRDQLFEAPHVFLSPNFISKKISIKQRIDFFISLIRRLPIAKLALAEAMAQALVEARADAQVGDGVEREQVSSELFGLEMPAASSAASSSAATAAGTVSGVLVLLSPLSAAVAEDAVAAQAEVPIKIP